MDQGQKLELRDQVVFVLVSSDECNFLVLTDSKLTGN
jgi:hypothetical protein